MSYDNHKFWMLHAIRLAEIAKNKKEIPVGAVILLNDVVIGEGWNCSIKLNDPTAHAEIIAIRQSGDNINNYRLLNSVMYVTLEPCIMCLGAIINARISQIIFGARNKKFCISNFLKNNTYINHKIIITKGILEKKCTNQLNNFFFM